MVRTTDHESRRRAVLAQTINTYIGHATPVSSEEIARIFNVSSATIRNIFSELEESGYLTHPYTSGGRIPTEKGYRYYVDFLISEIDLLEDVKNSIVNEYEKKIRKLEDALEQTSEILSSITHYTGIVSFLGWGDRFLYRGIRHILEHPEFHDVTKLRMLFEMGEEKKTLLDIINRDFSGKVKVYIGSELGAPEMEGCSLVVSGFQRKSQQSGRLAVLGPTRMEYGNIIPTVEYISGVLSEILDSI